MIGRNEHQQILKELLTENKSSFVAVKGRRRVGKTYLIDQTLGSYICFQVTGIQNGDLKTQLYNFTQKLAEFHKDQLVLTPKNWQEAFILLKKYLRSLSTKKKQVLFFDELPWMHTHKSDFIQLLAHLWNDYLSKEKHFIVVICGSASSWITKKIQKDKGGFHNRLTHVLEVMPFTLKETHDFLRSKKIYFPPNELISLYMILGGIPYYLENIKKGESTATAVDRLFYSNSASLSNEYQNLYKALFANYETHEKIIETLAKKHHGMTRNELLKDTKMIDGGSFSRAVAELIECHFISVDDPFQKNKKGHQYRLIDEFSLFYHKFIKSTYKKGSGTWLIQSTGQRYKSWTGYAFENICKKHISEIKKLLGIASLYTETSTFRKLGRSGKEEGFQIDLIVDRKDNSINLCECKYYADEFIVDKKYAHVLYTRKEQFRKETKTTKILFNTLITNFRLKKNDYSDQYLDSHVNIQDIIL